MKEGRVERRVGGSRIRAKQVLVLSRKHLAVPYLVILVPQKWYYHIDGGSSSVHPRQL